MLVTRETKVSSILERKDRPHDRCGIERRAEINTDHLTGRRINEKAKQTRNVRIKRSTIGGLLRLMSIADTENVLTGAQNGIARHELPT